MSGFPFVSWPCLYKAKLSIAYTVVLFVVYCVCFWVRWMCCSVSYQLWYWGCCWVLSCEQKMSLSIPVLIFLFYDQPVCCVGVCIFWFLSLYLYMFQNRLNGVWMCSLCFKTLDRCRSSCSNHSNSPTPFPLSPPANPFPHVYLFWQPAHVIAASQPGGCSGGWHH